MASCPMCGSSLGEATAERNEKDFHDAMEWYFKRNENEDWQEFIEWRNSKDSVADGFDQDSNDI